MTNQLHTPPPDGRVGVKVHNLCGEEGVPHGHSMCLCVCVWLATIELATGELGKPPVKFQINIISCLKNFKVQQVQQVQPAKSCWKLASALEGQLANSTHLSLVPQ